MGKIISISDKFVLLSEDNGMTWEVQSTFEFQSVAEVNDRLIAGSKNGRLIAGSKNDTGLWYSDDDGAYWVNSDKTTGNWHTIQYINGIVCAGSGDREGILYSEDFGEHWFKTNIVIGQFDNGVNKNNAVYLAGSSIVYSYDGKYFEVEASQGKNIVNKYGSTSEKYLYLDLHSKIFSYEEIDKKVLRIVNEVLLPSVKNNLLGVDVLNTGVYTTIKNSEGKKIVMGNEDVYKLFRSSSLINWKEDVGMQSFTAMTFSELLGDDGIIDAPLNEFDDLSDGDNERIAELISRTKLFLLYKRNILRNNINVDVSDCTIDDNLIVDATVDYSMLGNNLEAKRIFENAQKESVMVVVDKMLDDIYTFDEGNVRLLIYSAMFECIQSVVGKIKIKLIDINRQMYGKGEDYKVNIDDFSLKMNFIDGLETAYRHFISNITSNMQILNETDDKNLIAKAASFYKQEERAELLESLDKILFNCNFSPKNAYIAEENEIRNFKEELRNFIIDNASEGYVYIRDGVDSMFNRTFGFETNNKMKTVYKNTYNAIMPLYRNSLNTHIIFKYLNDSSLEEFSLDERKRIHKYLNEIHGKFLDRCLELMFVIYKQFPSLDELSVSDYNDFKSQYRGVLTLFKNSIDSFIVLEDFSENAVNNFFTSYKLKYIHDTIAPFASSFAVGMMNSYVSQKEVI